MAADQRRVWTAIADAFDRTRSRPWPHVVAFLAGLPKGSRVLDLMSGNGRHAKEAARLGHDVLALDWSLPLLHKATSASPTASERVLADAVALPLRDASVDACVFVAGLHGIPSAEGRAACLAELRRVLRHDGSAQVTVWSRHAPRFAALDLPPGPADVEVPWKGGGHDEARFYHLYTPAALRREAGAAGFTVAGVDAVSIAAKGPDNLVALLHAK